MSSTFYNNVKDDLKRFFSNHQKELFFNEKDLQLHLALFLKETKHYCDVDVEYYVPKEELGKNETDDYKKYVWNSQLYIDIVVQADGRYIPIELKYTTKRVERKINRFGESLNGNGKVEVLKNHGAQNHRSYDFWKDVRRLELLKKRFSKIEAGFAVFLTNDASYHRVYCKKTSTICEQMSVKAGKHGVTRRWQTSDDKIPESRPNFDLDNEYDVDWKPCSLDEEEFHFCILEVTCL